MTDSLKQQRAALAHVAMQDPKILAELVARLSGSSRRDRQNAASCIALVAEAQPDMVFPHAEALIDALEKPEAQTRWESLEALRHLMSLDIALGEKALSGAEEALFDDDSDLLHLAAVRFMCTFGVTSEERSQKVWPLLDEAIQCYHGDSEFQDMLTAIIQFAEGGIASDVAESLAARMAFDAKSGKGATKKRAQQILEILEAR